MRKFHFWVALIYGGITQLGPLLVKALSTPAVIKAVTIVSAFTSRATVIRLKKPLHTIHDAKAKVRLVVGVDMGGTSKEVLTELASWPVEVFVFKNRKNGVTFHPKIYVVERGDSAEIFVGSNNLTDGGLFSNYEGAAQVSYVLPRDADKLAAAKVELAKFLNPSGPVAKRLDEAYLAKLVARNDIPSEAEARQRRKTARVGPKDKNAMDDTFGFEPTPGAAALPIEYQDVVIAANTHQMENIQKTKRKMSRKEAKPSTVTVPGLGKGGMLSVEPMAQISEPSAFYMELNATKGKKGNIPGEQRVPLEAVWSTKDFWGWPDNYTKSVNPRKGKATAAASASKKVVDRVYHNWHPAWRISMVGHPSKSIEKTVRMYLYENSSDFRFTSGDIAKWGDPGDIVRIVHIDEGPVEYECSLAKKGAPEHAQWLAFCKKRGRSKRVYGFS